MFKSKLSIIGMAVIAASFSTMASAAGTVSDAGKTSDLYRNNIQTQMDRELDLRDRQAGVGAFVDQGLSEGGNIFSAGVQGAYRVYDGVVVGGALQMPVNTQLSGDYSSAGTSNPNFSFYTKYQENNDGTGLNAKFSSAYGYQKLKVQPEGESGKSKLYGYGFGAQAGYGFGYGDVVLTPYTGIQYTNIEQQGFNAGDTHYGRFSEERTLMQFGAKGVYTVNPTLRFDADMGVNANLKTHRHEFSATQNGVTQYSSSDDNKLQPYIGIGMTADIDNNSSVRVSGDINRQSYDNTAGQVGVAYQYRF